MDLLWPCVYLTKCDIPFLFPIARGMLLESYQDPALDFILPLNLQETVETEVIDGLVPFFREKPKDIALIEGEPLQLSCLVAAEPKAAIHWLKNDLIFMEDSRYALFVCLFSCLSGHLPLRKEKWVSH